MSRRLALCSGVFVFAMLASNARSQEVAPPEDPVLVKDLAAVASPASVLNLKDVRAYLAENRQAAEPQVAALLSNSDPQVRKNAAIVLSDIAKAGHISLDTLAALQTAVQDKDLGVAYWGFMGLMSDGVPARELQAARLYVEGQGLADRPLVLQLLGDADLLVRMNAAIMLSDAANGGDTSAATLRALQTAAKDKELSVAYWGFQGLMSSGVPAADVIPVIGEMMKMDLPRPLRFAALSTIDAQKPAVAAPILVSHLQEMLKEYKAQVETVVSSQEPPPLLPGGAPAPGYAPYEPYYGPTGAPGAPGAGRFAPANGGGPEGQTPYGYRPGAGRFGPAYGGGPEGQFQVPYVYRANLPNMTPEQLQALAQRVEALPIAGEVHQTGLALEGIVANVSPEAPAFGFKTTPPWDLDKCVDKAVIYMNSHRAEYGAAPAAPRPPARAPSAPTAAAPATTAAAPAATTP